MAERTVRFYKVLLEGHQGQTILIVGHGGCLNILLSKLLQVPLNFLWTFRLNPASFSEIVVSSQGPMLITMNLVPSLESKELSIIQYGKSEKVEAILQAI